MKTLSKRILTIMVVALGLISAADASGFKADFYRTVQNLSTASSLGHGTIAPFLDARLFGLALS